MNSNTEHDPNDEPAPILDQEDAATILELYQEYSYATPYHVLFTLMWRTGLRIDEVHALDLDDYHLDEQYVEIHHRPDTGTGLADGRAAERHVALTPETCDLVEDFRGKHRHDVTDEYDREPLVTTEHGRPTRSLLEVTMHSPTRPCIYEGRCPHDRDPDECEATQGVLTARKCPSSLGPAVVRGSAATRWLSEGIPNEVVSERMNIPEDELDQHYDERTPHEQMEQRREYFDRA